MPAQLLSSEDSNQDSFQCVADKADGHESEAGFTLVELLVVLAIIALLAALVAPQILKYLGGAKVDAARAQIHNIESALDLYYLDNGGYPSSEDGLAALSAAPPTTTHWNGPYLKGSEKLRDPWGNPYEYQRLTGDTSYLLRSLGRDGKVGGDGLDTDITN